MFLITILQYFRLPGRLAQVNALKAGSLSAIVIILAIIFKQIPIALMLILGIMAAALAETPSNYKSRLKTFFLLTISFFITITSVQALSNFPWLFIIGLGSSTFLFVMISALGESFRAVGFASLIVAIYTMLGANDHQMTSLVPLWLLAGAASYMIYAFIWQFFLTNFSLRQQLASLFYALAHYQREKSKLYDLNSTVLEKTRFKLAEKNRAIVSSLEECRTLLLLDERRFANDPQYRYWYHLYMVAQRLHESSASTHLSNIDARTQLINTPVGPLLRKQLLQFAIESRNLAQALEKNRFFTPNSELEEHLIELNSELEKLQQDDENTSEISLTTLGKNLNQMAAIYRKGIFTASAEKFAINKIQPLSAIQSLKSQFNLKSPLMRHAIRLSTCLCLGYIAAKLIFDSHGFWILLTSLMLCRQDFASTIRRLGSRVAGTCLGVLSLSLILPLVDYNWGLLLVSSLCITAFFLFLRHQYAIAVFFITWLAGIFFYLQESNHVDYSYYRLGETLVGCVITIAILLLMWPDWKTRRLDLLSEAALTDLSNYLSAIAKHFDQCNVNSESEAIDYRIARRRVHTAEARLLDTLSSIQVEPKQNKNQSRALHEFTMAYHQILSYSSAIAAHKQAINSQGKLNPSISILTQILELYRQQLTEDELTSTELTLECEEVINNNEQVNAKQDSSHQKATVKPLFEELDQQLALLLTQLKGENLLVCYQVQQIALVLKKMQTYLLLIK